MLSPAELQALSASRWAVPVLAFMNREGGARFAVLARRLGVAPSALRRALERLEQAGWLYRNPGHGHPLRPEYLLTDAGRPVAAWCEGVMEARGRLSLGVEDLGRWTLPLVKGLDRRWRRFSALEAELAPITPRALSLALKGMIGRGLADRRLEDAFPPLPLYGLTARGQALARALA
jgi:DNA-binding HxlR family transcriptional regulator